MGKDLFMVAQCIVIILILLVITFLFVRAKRKQWAFATLPLIVVPLVNVASHYIYEYLLHREFDDFTAVVINSISVLLSGIWIGIMSGHFERKTNKISYIGVCVAFNILLALILVGSYG